MFLSNNLFNLTIENYKMLVMSKMNFIQKIYLNYNSIYYDNIIVGGGIIGSSLFYHIANVNQKDSTLLIDKNYVASGTTGLSVGLIYNGFKEKPELLSVNKLLSINSNPLIISNFYKFYLSASTISILDELKKNTTFDYEKKGSLLVSSLYSSILLFKYFYISKKMGQDISLITKYNLETIEPNISGSFAIKSNHSISVNPIETSYSFIKMAKRTSLNCSVKENTHIVDIIKPCDEEFYFIKSNKGDIYKCRRLILSNGLQMNDLLKKFEVKLPIVPVKGYVLNIDNTHNIDIKHNIYYIDSFNFWFNNKTLNYLYNIPEFITHNIEGEPYNSKLNIFRKLYNYLFNINYNDVNNDINNDIKHIYIKVIGNCSDQDDIKYQIGFNRQLASSIFDYESNFDHTYVQKNLSRFFKNTNLNDIEENTYLGLMPFSLNGYPILGNLKEYGHPNIWIANGFGPYGVSIGPALTKLLVNKIYNIEDPENIIYDYYHKMSEFEVIN